MPLTLLPDQNAPGTCGCVTYGGGGRPANARTARAGVRAGYRLGPDEQINCCVLPGASRGPYRANQAFLGRRRARRR